ncbi:MAG: hypothetical protein HYT42_00985 [Candidatus Sungbacteria bacterium]|nr:hypothetical protein [Candidatus Sungbacteria bacterium]
MELEIERKFFVLKIPDLTALKSISDERYYLYSGNGVELRFQARGDKYELERMSENGNLSRSQEKIKITKEEFEVLKPLGKGPIIRESYLISESPQITIKIYHGKFEGLVRAEVEFKSLEEAKKFQPPDWLGKEMIDSPVARDANLVSMDEEEFRKSIRS